mmetsp:Transcript_13119/g.40967  ORF Transcript_13119/g.40967 Transcript_13119/m.40967 type:complete len:270 (+) Transcript_13119:2213-3022(+)
MKTFPAPSRGESSALYKTVTTLLAAGLAGLEKYRPLAATGSSRLACSACQRSELMASSAMRRSLASTSAARRPFPSASRLAASSAMRATSSPAIAWRAAISLATASRRAASTAALFSRMIEAKASTLMPPSTVATKSIPQLFSYAPSESWKTIFISYASTGISTLAVHQSTPSYLGTDVGSAVTSPFSHCQWLKPNCTTIVGRVHSTSETARLKYSVDALPAVSAGSKKYNCPACTAHSSSSVSGEESFGAGARNTAPPTACFCSGSAV